MGRERERLRTGVRIERGGLGRRGKRERERERERTGERERERERERILEFIKLYQLKLFIHTQKLYIDIYNYTDSILSYIVPSNSTIIIVFTNEPHPQPPTHHPVPRYYRASTFNPHLGKR